MDCEHPNGGTFLKEVTDDDGNVSYVYQCRDCGMTYQTLVKR